MSDTLLSTLDTGGSLLLNIDCSIDSGDSCDYTYTNENDAPLTGVSFGADGECAERLHSLAILGSSDDLESHSETLSPSSTKPRGMQKNKIRTPRTGVASSANTGTANRSIIQCLMCQKTFNNSSALAKHKLIHSDERKYACTLCSKAFKRQDHLNGHMMTHYSKKPYECKFAGCDKSYCDARSLRRHLENHHQQLLTDSSCLAHSDSGTLTPASAPPDATGGVFSFDLPFLQHPGSPGSGSGTTSMTPNGSSTRVWPAGFYPFDEPKRVKCSICDRRFRNLPALNGHMRLHGGYMKKDVGDSGKKLDNSSHERASPTTSGSSRVHLQKRSFSSHHLITSTDSRLEGDSQLIVVKPEVNCGGSVMSVNPTFAYDDGQCTGGLSRNVDDIAVKSDLSADSQSDLFGYNWIDGNRPSIALEPITIKPEPSTDGGGNVRQYEDFVSRDVELTRYVGSRDQYIGHSTSFESQDCMNDVCLGSAGSSQQHADGRVNSVEIVAPDVSMDGIKHQQMLVDDNVSDFVFNAGNSPLISSQSMPHLPTYTSPEVMKYPSAAGYRMSGMFAEKSQSFVDASFSHNGSASMAYSGLVQHDVLASEQDAAYGRCFSYSDHGPHNILHFQNSDQQRPNQPEGYFSSVPRTPTLYTAVGPKPVSQPSGHRTPRTPYTPSTPGRASRFQFPSITEGAVVGTCQHRYQKSTAYHPYGHQHTPTQTQQLTTLGPASPHYLHQRHVASIAHEMDQQQFRHDVAHAQQEIEQRLQQLQHEDKMKQMMIAQQTSTDAAFSGAAITAHCNTNTMSADRSVSRNVQASQNAHDTQQPMSPVDEVLQLIMRDAPEMSQDTANVSSIVPHTAALQLKSEAIAGAAVTAYPHSASDSLLSQITCSNVMYDQNDLKKLRRKHKPEPLFIPPDVNNFGNGDSTMQWNCAGSDRFKTEFPSNTSAAVMSGRIGVGSGAHLVQQTNNYGEPRSAPPFHWSSAVMSFSNFDADSVLADLPP